LLDIPKSKAKPWGTKQLLKHYEKMKKWYLKNQNLKF
jgi:hypothetical protein